MDNLIHADIFFFLTSIAVAVFTIAFAIIAVLLIKTLSDLRALVSRVRRDTDRVLDLAENVAEAVAGKAGGVAGALGVLGSRMWKAQRAKGSRKKSSK